MRLETIPIDRLLPAPYNPRVELRPGMPGYERLKRSLSEFDLVQPPVWNRTTGHVVGGHQRLRILRDQGATEVPCIVVELPLDREQALNIALNNPQVGGDWDAAKLGELLDELQALPDFDATLTGFSEDELRHLTLRPATVPTTASDPEDEPTSRSVTLEIPIEDWDAVRPALDAWLAAHPQVRLHLAPSSRS
jgi:ParB-like chromosome segregation protein Spo0J